MKSNIRNKAVIFIVSIYLFGISGCPLSAIIPSLRPTPKPEGIPDPLARDNINQFVIKGPNWQQIVQDKTIFALGEPDRYPTSGYINHSYGSFPAMDGSTVLIPLAAEFVWQFLNLSDELYQIDPSYYHNSETLRFLNFSTTANAYNRIIYGWTTEGYITIPTDKGYIHYLFSKRPDIVLATHPSVDELNKARDAGIELIIKPICYDSFVFITHKDNPVESLTALQIQKIYSGEITNWQDVGGEELEIVAYQREPNSGSQTAMEEMVMRGIPMTKAPQAKIVMAMGELVNKVAGYENGTMSLGYTYKYYVDRLYNHPDIKILKVNGVMPSDENVRNNSYAFIAPYNAVIRSTDINNTGGKFLNWILSHEGQLCVAQAGYVTLQDLNKNTN